LGPAVSGWTSSITSDDIVNMNSTRVYASAYSPRKTNPYMLPCIITSVIGIIGFIVTAIFLPETLFQDSKIRNEGYASVGSEDEVQVEDVTPIELPNVLKEGTVVPYSSEELDPTPVTDENDNPKDNETDNDCKSEQHENGKLFNDGFVVCLITYSLLSFTQMFIDDVIPLWTLASRSRGGLDYGTKDTGTLLAIGGAFMLFSTVFIYPVVAKYMLSTTVMITFSCFSGVLVLTEPIIVYLFENLTNTAPELVWFVLVLLNGTRVSSTMIAFNANFLLTNNTIPMKLRGRGNGVSMAAASFAKMLAPASGALLFAWSIKAVNDIPTHKSPFDWHFVFILDGLLMFAVALMVYMLMPRSANHPLEKEYVEHKPVAAQMKSKEGKEYTSIQVG